jgi:hypothetical protein
MKLRKASIPKVLPPSIGKEFSSNVWAAMW